MVQNTMESNTTRPVINSGRLNGPRARSRSRANVGLAASGASGRKTIGLIIRIRMQSSSVGNVITCA